MLLNFSSAGLVVFSPPSTALVHRILSCLSVHNECLPPGLPPAGTAGTHPLVLHCAACLQAGLMPGRVHFLWVARHPKEFCILDADILAAAM